ncbi:MAG: hypothetical protein QOF74_6766 [Caballeronia mineralivorans]|jgi:hypothetical protein|nr:hypothetical protein [Caballeronia mineralivorans]
MRQSDVNLAHHGLRISYEHSLASVPDDYIAKVPSQLVENVPANIPYPASREHHRSHPETLRAHRQDSPSANSFAACSLEIDIEVAESITVSVGLPEWLIDCR